MIKIIQKNVLIAGLISMPILLGSCTMYDYRPVSRVDSGYSDADSYYQNNDENYSSGRQGSSSSSPSAAESKPKSRVEPSNQPAVPLAAPVAASPTAQ